MFFKRKTHKFFSVASGMMVPLESVNDETFSSGMMGPGYGIIPDEGKIFAPIDGTIKMIFPTGHAIGITGNDGKDVLIHIGIDTVNLNGEGFNVKVGKNETIKKGQLLLEFDIDVIKQNGLDPTVIVVFLESKGIELPSLPCKVKGGEKIN